MPEICQAGCLKTWINFGKLMKTFISLLASASAVLNQGIK